MKARSERPDRPIDRLHLCARQRLTEQKTLHFGEAETTNLAQLLLGFDAFGRGCDVERLGQHCNRFNDRDRLLVLADVLDEAAIDLELVCANS